MGSAVAESVGSGVAVQMEVKAQEEQVRSSGGVPGRTTSRPMPATIQGPGIRHSMEHLRLARQCQLAMMLGANVPRFQGQSR